MIEAKIINRGNCMLCGKELTEDEGIFFCKECGYKIIKDNNICHECADEILVDPPESEEDEIISNNLCDSCSNIGCEFQSGIVRTKCAFYIPPHIEPDNCGNYIVQKVR